jgi:hypothetical protein
MKTFLLVFTAIVLIITVYSCKKNQTESMDEQLKGQWVRTDIRSDTLIFGYYSNNWVEIRRGYEIIDGNKTEKVPNGLFEYGTANDSINFNWIASSSFSTKKYLFKLYNSKMDIGDFIDSTNVILTFEKIK